MDTLHTAIQQMLDFWGIEPTQVEYNAGFVYFRNRQTGALHSLVPSTVPAEFDVPAGSEPTANHHKNRKEDES